MNPNFFDGEKIIAYKDYYKDNVPDYGDVVLTNIETEGNEHFLKRVIALPGDKVRTFHGSVYINNKKRTLSNEISMNVYEEILPNGYTYKILNTTKTYDIEDFDDTVLPKDFIFILGDNRRNSLDSRITGLIETSNLLHKVVDKNHMINYLKFILW